MILCQSEYKTSYRKKCLDKIRPQGKVTFQHLAFIVDNVFLISLDSVLYILKINCIDKMSELIRINRMVFTYTTSQGGGVVHFALKVCCVYSV